MSTTSPRRQRPWRVIALLLAALALLLLVSWLLNPCRPSDPVPAGEPHETTAGPATAGSPATPSPSRSTPPASSTARTSDNL